MKITIPYTPRKQQAYLHNNLDKFRYSLLCCHRRFGKTVLCILQLIKCAMTNKNHNPRFAYIAPTYSQAKKIAWDYLKHYTQKIPGTKYNETELRCDLINGARISLLSSENPDSNILCSSASKNKHPENENLMKNNVKNMGNLCQHIIYIYI